MWIERELRDYDKTKAEWEVLLNEVYSSSPAPSDGQPRGSGTSNPTESKVLRLVSNARLAQIEKTVRSFEKVISNLPEEKFKLIQMRYWDTPRTLTDDGIAIALSISRPTLYRWVDGIMLALAIELGFVD